MLHLIRGLFKFAKFLKRIFQSKKAKTLALAILLVIIILPIYFWLSGRSTEASWWDEKWAFRKSIQLTNSGAVQTNVYVALTVDTSDTTKFQADCGDLRFTKNDGKVMPYLIVSGCGTANTSVYVSFETFPAGEQAIWEYYGNPGAENGFTQTQTGAVTQANMKLSIVNGTAFVDFSAANVLTNNLNSKLFIADNAGLELIGYIKAAGSGESLGSELVLNPGFETGDPPSDWHAWYATLSRVTDPRPGSSGAYSLNVLATGNTAGASSDIIFTSGALYYMSIWLRNVDQTDGACLFQTFDYYNLCSIDSGDTAWTSCGGYRTKADIAQGIDPNWWSPISPVGKSFRVDDASARQIISPSVTGTTITSTQNGSTFNWTSEESGFNRNDTSNYTYTIFPTNFSTEASTYSVGALGTEEISPAPVAYWSFDEGQGAVAHDESANKNDGSITGATWKPESDCVSGKCLSFNGTSDYVDMGNDSSLDMTGDFTLSLWFNSKTWTTGSAYKTLMSKRDEYGSMDWEWFYNSGDSAMEFWFGTSGIGQLYFSLGVDPSTNQWHHIILTRSGNDFEMYLDGVSKGTDSSSASIPTGDKLRIGAWFGGGAVNTDSLFQGSIDEPKIYPYARTQAQILQDYNAGLASQSAPQGASAAFGSESTKWLTDGLVGYWKMDEASWSGTSGEVKDASDNNNNGTSAGGVTTAGGKFGNGGSFDGGDDYVNVGALNDATAFDNSFSISGWFYRNVNDTSEDHIIDLDFQKQIHITSNQLNFQDPADGLYLSSTGTITQNTWYHFSIVYDFSGKNLIMYLNGEKNNQTSATLSLLTPNVRMGEYIGGGNYYFPGKIDETRIYNRALSPSEIKKLYEWAPGPVLHLKMDEKVQGDAKTIADDSTYGNNGTTHYGANTTGMDCTVPGKFGSACNFDGVDDWINCGNGSSLQSSGTVSVGMWINSSHAGWNLFAKKQLYNDNGWWFGTDTLGRLYLYILSGGTFRAQNAPTVVTDGKWHFVSATYDGYKVVYYVDGVNTYTYDWGSYLAVGNTSYDLYIASGPSEDPFLGLIDDVRVYNYARTQQQILDDMLGTPEPAGGGGNSQPIANYNFNEGYGSVAHNSGYGGASLAGNLGVGSSAPTWTNDGKNGKALSFDGTNDYVDAGTYGARPEFSVSYWCKPTAGESCEISKYFNGGDWGGEWVVAVDPDHKAHFSDWIGSYHDTTGTTVMQSGQWYHFVFSFDSSDTKKIFINGKLEASLALSGDIESLTAQKIIIGGRSLDNSPAYAGGVFDDVKLYNYALTEDEVKSDYNSGYSAVVGSSGTTSAGAPSNSDSRQYCVPGDTSTCSAPVGEWLMDEKVSGDAKNLNDTSGNGNNGTTVDGANNTGMDCTQPGKVGKACTFDGVDDYAALGTDLISTNTVTVCAWIKPQGKNVFDGIVSNSRFVFMSYNHGANLALTSDDGSSAVISDKTLNLNTWQYVCGVRLSNGTGTLYINGAQSGSSNTGTPVTGYGLAIGNSQIGEHPYGGQIDQVRIYNYARTPAQIAWEYNQGRPIAEWRMNECQGTAIHDDSGNGNTGTLNLGASGQTTTGTCSANANTPWYNGRTGKYAASLNFDGGDDWALVSNSSSLNITGNSMTVSMWAKSSSPGNWEGLVWKSDAPLSYGYLLYTGSAGNLQFGVHTTNSGGVISGDSGNIVWDNSWHFITGIYDGANVYIYVDGIARNHAAATGNIVSSDSVPLYLGSSNNGYFFPGQIDEVKIFNYALTAEQVKQLYNNSSALNFQ